MDSAVIPSANIDSLLARREAFRAKVELASKILAEAKELYVASPLGHTDAGDMYRRGFEYLPHDSSASNCAINAEAFGKGWDAFSWDYLLRASGMRTFLSAAAKKRWDKSIHDRDTPELTRENIAATFEKLHASRGDLFDEGVVECFRYLSWDYKTNNPRMFGKKLILTGYGSISRDSCAKIDDLRHAFAVADRKPEPDCRHGVEAKFAYGNARSLEPFEAPYMKAKAFINGNIHVWFKRPDLIQFLNTTLARACPGALAPPRD